MSRFVKTAETLSPGAQPLPSSFYIDAQIFQLEMERIFCGRWLCLGRASQLQSPGDYFLAQIGAESLIILSDRSGKRRAFFNVCRHRGSRLSTQDSGRFSGSIQCPYHAWTFDLDGRLIGAPLMEAVSGFQKKDYPLVEAPLVEWEGFLLTNLARRPKRFEKAFAPLLGKFSAWGLPTLHCPARIEYVVRANWKLIAQNYSECYHCPVIHPELARKSPYRSGRNDLFEGPFLGGYMDLDEEAGSLTVSGRSCAPPLGSVAGEDLRRVYYYLVFPNLLLSLHPDYVMAHFLWPQQAGLTRVVCEWYFAPEAPDSTGIVPQEAVRFWDLTNRQDWEICEATQLGVGSRVYSPAPYSGQESLLAAFDQEVRRSLGGLRVAQKRLPSR
jgi:Rieske 2Fe-2S family protein